MITPKLGKKTFVFCAVTALTVSAACGAEEGAAEGEDHHGEVVLSQAFQSLLYLPVYVGIDNGYFEEEGIELELETAGGGPEAWSSVVGGSADFSIQAPEFVPITREGGGDGVIVSSIYDAPGSYVVGFEDIDMQEDLTPLEGSRLITSPEPDTFWAFATLLVEEHGLEDVEFIPVQPGNQIAALLGGQGDFAIASEPALSEAILEEGVHVVHSFPDNEDWHPYMYSSLTSTPDFLQDNPEATQGLINGLQRSMTFIRDEENFDEVLAIAAEWFPETSEDVIESAVTRGIETNGYPESVVLTEEAFNNNMEVALFVGNVEELHSEATSYENNVNTEFAENAAEDGL